MSFYWNPRQYLNIDCQCNGITKKSTRCKASVKPDSRYVASLLNRLSRKNIAITGRDREIDALLEDIAYNTLCKRSHREKNSQVQMLLLGWSRVLNDFIQSQAHQRPVAPPSVSQAPVIQTSHPNQQHTSEVSHIQPSCTNIKY
jgi:hypothetical protein